MHKPLKRSGPPRRQRLAQSTKVFDANVARRKGHVLVLRGLGKPEFRIMMPAQFAKMNVDESYQRLKITTEVNDLVHVIKNGGDIPDPITVARRANGDLYIVDGQQRWWAHSETGTPLKCMIYDVDSIEAEKNLYIACNTQVKLGNNYLVKSWAGIGAEILRKLNEEGGSGVEGQIDFGINKSRPLTAASAIRAMCVAATGGVGQSQGMLQKVLRRLDFELEHNQLARDRARAIVLVISDVFSRRDRFPALPMIALARVAHKRWAGRPKPLPPGVIGRLQKIQWERVVDSYKSRNLPVLEAEIERRWKD